MSGGHDLEAGSLLKYQNSLQRAQVKVQTQRQDSLKMEFHPPRFSVNSIKKLFIVLSPIGQIHENQGIEEHSDEWNIPYHHSQRHNGGRCASHFCPQGTHFHQRTQQEFP